MRRFLAISVAGLLTATAVPANAGPLTGQTATASLTPFSNSTNLVQFASPKVVGNGVEFTGSFADISGGGWLLSVDIYDTGFLLGVTANRYGNFFGNSTNNVTIRLSGLSGLGPISSAGYTCVIDNLAGCGIFSGYDPSLVRMGSDATSAFVTLIGLRSGETYNFSFLDAAAVPEPATWAMMVLGFGMLGAAVRRRRVSTIVPVA